MDQKVKEYREKNRRKARMEKMISNGIVVFLLMLTTAFGIWQFQKEKSPVKPEEPQALQESTTEVVKEPVDAEKEKEELPNIIKTSTTSKPVRKKTDSVIVPKPKPKQKVIQMTEIPVKKSKENVTQDAKVLSPEVVKTPQPQKTKTISAEEVKAEKKEEKKAEAKVIENNQKPLPPVTTIDLAERAGFEPADPNYVFDISKAKKADESAGEWGTGFKF